MPTFLSAVFLLLQASSGVDSSLRKEVEAVFAAAEAESVNHKWAGIYEQAVQDDVYARIAITADGRIAFERYGASGLIEANVGALRMDGENIDIAWKHSEKFPNRPTVEKEQLQVSWGEALILVPRSCVHGFCINARENRGLVFYWYFVRKPSELKVLVGQPTLPERYRVLTDLPAIPASVKHTEQQTFTAVNENMKLAIQTVTLDRGKADQVLVGMQLECEKTGRRYIVTAVESNSCTAKSEWRVEKNAVVRPARRGWVLRTASN